MRKYLTILSFLFSANIFAQTPTANAGVDQTIYLTQGNSVSLTGTATNINSSLWREVSTDYNSGATITNSTSLNATVSGLPQGVFYFELAVTSATSVTARDTVVVRVDYDPPPGTLLRSLSAVFPNIKGVVNDRTDTTNSGLNKSSHLTFPDGSGTIFYDQGRSNDMFIDALNGKFTSTIEDGYGWNGANYTRTEMSFGTFYPIDTSKTYCFEWKGYFPELLSTPNEIIVIWQLHGNDGNSPPFALRPSGGNLIFSDLDHSNTKTPICSLTELTGKVNTIRIYIKEGASSGLVKVEINGVQKYLRTTGQVGRFSDYQKFATLYDSYNSIVDASNHTRGKKFSLVTEAYNVYSITGIAAPTMIISGDQTITVSSTGVSASATWASGHSGTYLWTKTSGGSATITNNNSSSATISGLTTGTYVFRCTATQDDGQSVYREVTINVSIPNVSPTANAGAGKTIQLPTNSVSVTGGGTDTDGTIVSYLWTKISGGAATITSPTSANTTITSLVQGTYVFQLQVTDNNGGTGTDQMTVVVSAANVPPTANAGSDITIQLPANSVTLVGSGADADGTVASYLWAKISGGSVTITTPTASTTTVTGLLAQGTYIFTLTVTDNQGAQTTDRVTVTVQAANVPPTANAGSDQTITLPTNTITLFGSGADSDGSVASYSWAKISGSTFTISNANVASPTLTNLLAGTYVFRLSVTDNQGAIKTDDVTITVNIPPIAHVSTNLRVKLPHKYKNN